LVFEHDLKRRHGINQESVPGLKGGFKTAADVPYGAQVASKIENELFSRVVIAAVPAQKTAVVCAVEPRANGGNQASLVIVVPVFLIASAHIWGAVTAEG